MKWINGDDQPVSFKGQHVNNIQINFKKEGDGFQDDAICGDGYSLYFYFCKEPSLEKYLKHGFSPMHRRMFAFFCWLEDEGHQVGMDNFYNSVTFSYTCTWCNKEVRNWGSTCCERLGGEYRKGKVTGGRHCKVSWYWGRT